MRPYAIYAYLRSLFAQPKPAYRPNVRRPLTEQERIDIVMRENDHILRKLAEND